ncbi:P-loop containing nucleoside triphosphate hydrolase protein [Cryomyces antarcticus]
MEKHNKSINSERAFDVYARPFVPRTFTALNESPATRVYTSSSRDKEFSRYLPHFIGQLFAGTEHPDLAALLNMQFLDSDILHNSLTREGYYTYFLTCINLEAQARQTESSSNDLFKAHIQTRDYQQQLYNLQVPGLRENSLRIERDDLVMLRQLRLDHQGLPYGMNAWLQGGAFTGQPAPGWTGVHYNASVFGIHKASETLVLRIEDLYPESMLFNVMFTMQRKRFETLIYALSLVHRSLQSYGRGIWDGLKVSNFNQRASLDSPRDCWIRRMLIPTENDGILQETLNKGVFRHSLFDEQLNFEQMKAVDSIKKRDYGDLPFIISGPPGTGKTKTLVETALQLLNSDQEIDHMVVCAPSDAAADTLAQRLRVHLKPPELLRLNAPSRTFEEVPEALLAYCFVEDATFSLPPLPVLLHYKIIVTTCRDAGILLWAKATNRDLSTCETAACSLLSALHKQSYPSTRRLHWGALLMDEAAQSTEPESLIPLAVVMPPDEAGPSVNEKKNRGPLLIMAGDQKQLGPRTASRVDAVRTSLFERLFERPRYRDHPLSRKRVNTSAPYFVLTQGMLPIIRPPFSNLVRNYRSHPSILAVPNVLFYNDTLIPEATGTDSLKTWTGWKGRRWPVLFACHDGLDEVECHGGGWYNHQEARVACSYASSLVRSGLIRQDDIIIMSPFVAQVRLLRQMIRAKPYDLWEVNIGPMEAFQGLESRFVILCTTRTRDRFLDQDKARGLGIINEPERFNVALTRAKDGLIVIGNPYVLAIDPHWTAFMSFCRRHDLWDDHPRQATTRAALSNGCMMDPWQPANESMPPPISGLETALVYKEDNVEDERGALSKKLGFFGFAAEDGSMYSSGLAVEALRDDVYDEGDVEDDEDWTQTAA